MLTVVPSTSEGGGGNGSFLLTAAWPRLRSSSVKSDEVELRTCREGVKGQVPSELQALQEGVMMQPNRLEQ